MITVTNKEWEYLNEMAEYGIKFGVALKCIRQALISGNHPEDKVHDIELSMQLTNRELDKFIQGSSKND